MINQVSPFNSRRFLQQTKPNLPPRKSPGISNSQTVFSRSVQFGNNQAFSLETTKMLEQLKSKYMHLKDKNVLLLYSGGLDTSFLTKFFNHEIGAKVYTASFDVGEDLRELKSISDRARQLGAVQHIHVDLKEPFANDRCAKAILANALYQDSHPLSSSLSRPLMSEAAIGLAEKHNCVGIIHGSSPWQNNPPRFNNALRSLSRTIEPITPVLDNNISRKTEDEYLRHFGVIIRKGEDKLFSADYNLWAPEVEDGVLQKIQRVASEDLFRLTKPVEKTTDTPQNVDLEFKRGLPVRYETRTVEDLQKFPDTPFSLKGRPEKSLLQMVQELNHIGGEHGIGRYDTLEHRPSGFKEREVHEAPAANIIIEAKKELERTVLDQKTLNKKGADGRLWTEMVCEGDWFHPLVQHLSKSLEDMNQRVNGMVRMKLYKGSAMPVARASEQSLDFHNTQADKAFANTSHPNASFFTWRGADGIFSRRTEKKDS